MTDIEYMKEALSLALEAESLGDVPIGAVIVRKSDGEIIGRGKNDKEAGKNPLGHAEINAIREAAKSCGRYLSGCMMYVTLEPCPMCAGALINSRIDRVVFAAKDSKAGAMGSVINLNSYPLNHKITVECGLCEEEAMSLLRDFFKGKRNK